MRPALLVVVATLTAAATPAVAGTGASLVRYLPDNASEIVVVDMAHARTSASIDKLIAQLRGRSPRWDALAADGLRLDLALDTLVLAATPDPNGGMVHTIAIADGMAGPILAHLKTPATPETDHAGIAIWAIDRAEEAAIIDRHLVITTSGDMAATIDRARTRSRPQPSNADTLRAILTASESSGADVTGGAIVSAPDRMMAASRIGAEPLWVSFSIAASVRASIDIRVAFGDDAAATTAAKLLDQTVVAPSRLFLLGAIGPELVDSLAVETDHAQIRLSASMPADEVVRLVDLFSRLD